MQAVAFNTVQTVRPCGAAMNPRFWTSQANPQDMKRLFYGFTPCSTMQRGADLFPDNIAARRGAFFFSFVSQTMRRHAKVFNGALLYGIVVFL